MDSSEIILLSIRRPFSQLILTGQKKYELRKRPPRRECEFAVIYETLPTKAIIGFFELDRIHVECIEKIWKITKGKSYVTKEYFESYFKDRKFGVAIEIKESKRLDTHLKLSDIGINRAPQDFMYIERDKFDNLIRV